MDHVSADKTRDKTAGRVIRWLVFIPAAIAFSVALRFAVVLSCRVILGKSSAVGVVADILIGAIAFIWAGAVIAPSRRSGTAITLASVYTVLCVLVELFRETIGIESVSHSVRLLAIVAGSLAGLFLALRQIKSDVKRDTIRTPMPEA
jgi:hypothetical protein